MRLKQYIVLLIIVNFLNPQYLKAQSNQLHKADRYFSNQEYALAIKYYEEYLNSEDNFEVLVKLAHCYQAIQQDEKAENIFHEIVHAPQAKHDHYLDYALLLKKSHKYSDAKIWFEKYAEAHPDDKQVTDFIRSCNLINELEYDSLYIVTPLNINTPQSDFASAFYKKGIVFVSGRPNKTSRSIDGRTGEHYLDLYYSEKKDNKYTRPTPFSETFNSKYHEGPVCFSKNQRFIYFTRNKQSINLQGNSELNIYTSRFNGRYWDKPELFEFTGFYYSMGHPSLSPDGKSLYFISNMEGGYGGTDIYVCYKQGFSWSRPINLGPKINTSGNEMFPFMAEDGFLYFASDGHIGLGGLDIFKSRFDQNVWTLPINLGPPFNSSKDDFAFFINENKDKGYFSSNRDGGKGSDDIYEFVRDINKVAQLSGRICDTKTRNALGNVKVLLMASLSKEGVATTDDNGNFNFQIDPKMDYSLIISNPGYKTKRILHFGNRSQSNRKPHINILMDATPWEKLEGTITDQSTADALEGTNIQVINRTYNIHREVESDKMGNFVLDIDPEKTYNLIISQRGYFTKVVKNYRFEKGKTEKIELQRIARNRYMELTGSDFSEGEWSLTPNTLSELDNLAGLLRNNPHIAVELGAYTYQDKGKKDNEQICDMRAQEAAKYVVSKGIAANRIVPKSLGYNKAHAQLVVKVVEAF